LFLGLSLRDSKGRLAESADAEVFEDEEKAGKSVAFDADGGGNTLS